MTAQELAAVRDRDASTITTPRTTYSAADDFNHDRYGNDTRDHHVFDHNHTEDVFPY